MLDAMLERLIKEGYVLVRGGQIAEDAPGWTYVLRGHLEELMERGVIPDTDFAVWYSRESDDFSLVEGSESYAYIAVAGRHGEPLYDQTIVELVRPRFLVARIWIDSDDEGEIYRFCVVTSLVRNTKDGDKFLGLEFRAHGGGGILRSVMNPRPTWFGKLDLGGHCRPLRSDEWAVLGGFSGLVEQIRSHHGFPRYDRIETYFGQVRFPALPAILRVN